MIRATSTRVWSIIALLWSEKNEAQPIKLKYFKIVKAFLIVINLKQTLLQPKDLGAYNYLTSHSNLKKLQRYQNLMSIIGDGNTKLASQLAKTEQHEVAKSLAYEIKKEQQKHRHMPLLHLDEDLPKNRTISEKVNRETGYGRPEPKIMIPQTLIRFESSPQNQQQLSSRFDNSDVNYGNTLNTTLYNNGLKYKPLRNTLLQQFQRERQNMQEVVDKKSNFDSKYHQNQQNNHQVLMHSQLTSSNSTISQRPNNMFDVNMSGAFSTNNSVSKINSNSNNNEQNVVSKRSLILVKANHEPPQQIVEKPSVEKEVIELSINKSDAKNDSQQIQDEINNQFNDFESYHNETLKETIENMNPIISQEYTPVVVNLEHLNVEYKQMPLTNYEIPLKPYIRGSLPKRSLQTSGNVRKFQFFKGRKGFQQTNNEGSYVSGVQISNLNLLRSTDYNAERAYQQQSLSPYRSNPNSIESYRVQLSQNYLPKDHSHRPHQSMSPKKQIKDKKLLSLRINAHTVTLNDFTLRDDTIESYDQRNPNNKSNNKVASNAKQQINNNNSDESSSRPKVTKQKISLNKVLNHIIGSTTNNTPNQNISGAGIGNNYNNSNFEDMILIDDDTSSKALNTSTFLKQLDNRYNNAQNILSSQDMTQKDSILNKSLQSFKKRQVDKLKDQAIYELDFVKPVPVKGQLFSMPVSPSFYSNKSKENLTRQKSIPKSSTYTKAVKGENSQLSIISSKHVHKQFQLHNKKSPPNQSSPSYSNIIDNKQYQEFKF
ncbi:UNKNOWN [Stylonychia lemnae]|uniref:Uncharacterized protein n=1 Tax=Stylonychia lemnae TaxID=5949 RepID=A0A078A0C6_STYLE|nr:UNKNOWN [Stylonychia lemnae]|eukprot:CDW74893.1 UNKNOWN [Stylonychia lemnae]